MGELISCLQCGKSVSLSAKSCPSCHTLDFTGFKCPLCHKRVPQAERVSVSRGFEWDSTFFHSSFWQVDACGECYKTLITQNYFVPPNSRCADCNAPLQVFSPLDLVRRENIICRNCGSTRPISIREESCVACGNFVFLFQNYKTHKVRHDDGSFYKFNVVHSFCLATATKSKKRAVHSLHL